MNQILTDEELINIADDEQFWYNHLSYQECDVHALAKAIEQAIINKLNSADPVAWKGLSGHLVYDKKSLLPSTRELATPLYEQPPAQSAVEGWTLVPTEILDAFPEINPSSYDHDDACRLNAWGVELVLSAARNEE